MTLYLHAEDALSALPILADPFAGKVRSRIDYDGASWERRAAWSGSPSMDECNPAGGGSQDRASEPDEDLWRFGGDEPSPRPAGGSSLLVDRN